MPEKSTYWRSPKRPSFYKELKLTAGDAQKALLAGYMPPALAKRLLAVSNCYYLLHSLPTRRS